MNELVAIGHHAVVAANIVGTGILVVVVVEARPPVTRSLTLEQGQEASSLHAGGNGQSGRIKERLGEIKVRNDPVGPAPGLDHSWPAHQKGGSERLLEDPTLVEPAVFAKVKALVGRVNHNGVAGQLFLVQESEQPADALVDGLDASQVVVQVAI